MILAPAFMSQGRPRTFRPDVKRHLGATTTQGPDGVHLAIKSEGHLRDRRRSFQNCAVTWRPVGEFLDPLRTLLEEMVSISGTDRAHCLSGKNVLR